MLLGRDLWRSLSPAFCSKQDDHQCKIRSAVALPRQISYTPWYGESIPSLDDLFQCCINLPVNGYFLTSTISHPNCSMWPLALVHQLALLIGVWLHCLYGCSLGSRTPEWDHPLAFPSLNRTHPASSASLCRSPDQFSTPLTDPFQLPNISVDLEGPKLDTVFQLYSHQRWEG